MQARCTSSRPTRPSPSAPRPPRRAISPSTRSSPQPNETGAEAIHPGYGFLSENVTFARACAARGITFIGPHPEHIEAFALKHTARETARRCGVPLLPGTGLLADLNDALAQAERLCYPVMLKSSGGGGGIGMRVCHSAAELARSLRVRAAPEQGELR